MNTYPARIADLVSHWESTRPDRTAVRFGDAAWTWAEFADRVRRAAAAQRAAGLEQGDRVAFYDKNHPACLETILACAAVGTANAIVNFRLAPEEVAYTINDARAVVVFIGAEFLPVLEQIRGQLETVRCVVVVGGEADEYESWLASIAPLAWPHPHEPDDCFLQLYTSGTTGFPKGAMLTHRGVLAHSQAVADRNGVDSESVSMVPMPLFHVGGSGWALVSLYSGAETVVVREIVPNELLDELVARRVTHSFVVPAVFDFLLRVPDVAERDYSHVRSIAYGASPMPLPLLRRCLEVFRVDLRHVYGMTEAAGVVTSLEPEDHRDSANAHRLASAGKPIPGVRLVIAEPGGERVLGAGEVGEVVVHAEGLMAGYWARPEATAEVLTPEGWLRTGDAGYLDDDGYLYLTDRIKDMIISGGENVYPAEIERVLAEHPGVADVAVIGVAHEKWGEVPQAIVVGSEVNADELLAYCRERLASFKCPRTVTRLDELPRNAAGKVLKRELRDLYRHAPTVDT